MSKYCDLGSILSAKIEEKEPLIEGLLLPQDQLLIYGPGGTGKSLATLHIALALASVCPFKQVDLWHKFRIPGSEPTSTLFLQSENNLPAVHNRISEIAKKYPGIKEAFDKIFFPKIKNDLKISGDINNDKFLSSISDLIDNIYKDRGKKIGVIVWDPLISFHNNEENDNSRMRSSLDKISDFDTAHNTTSIVVHHAGKNGQMRGATATYDWARAVAAMKKSKNGIRVVCEKFNNGEEFNTFKLKKESCDLVPMKEYKKNDKNKDVSEESAVELYASFQEILSDPKNKKLNQSGLASKLSEHSGVSMSTARRRVVDSYNSGMLCEKITDGKKVLNLTENFNLTE